MTDFERLAVRALAVYYAIGAVGATVAGVLLFFSVFGILAAPLFLAIAALLAAVSVGLWRWRKWAWYVGVGVTATAVAGAVLNALVPAVHARGAGNLLGFVINAAALYALLQPGVKRRFLEGLPAA